MLARLLLHSTTAERFAFHKIDHRSPGHKLHDALHHQIKPIKTLALKLLFMILFIGFILSAAAIKVIASTEIGHCREAIDLINLRILSWNCDRAYNSKKKDEAFKNLGVDLAIVAEVGRDFAESRARFEDASEWLGSDEGNGLAILAFNGWKLRKADAEAHERIFLPCIASREGREIQIVGTCIQTEKPRNYNHHALNAFKTLTPFIASRPTIVAGDFNGTAAFERPVQFERVAHQLNELGLKSAWHKYQNEEFGSETKHTWQRNRRSDGETSHIDYIFFPDHLQLISAEILTLRDQNGKSLSDHNAVLAEFQIP